MTRASVTTSTTTTGTTMEFVILQHSEHLPAGVLSEVLAQRRRPARTIHLWKVDLVPAFCAQTIRGLIVLGGLGRNTADVTQHEAERALLSACVEAGTPVLGICLGAQLLAEVTGGGCARGAGMIGFAPVTRTSDAADDPMFAPYPDGMPALSLDPAALMPAADAVVLAHRADGTVAAFRVGETAYGISFHPELDADVFAELATHVDPPFPSALVEEARRRDAFHRGMGAALLGRWVDAVVGRTPAEQPWGRRGPQPVPGPGLSLHPA
jgi:GMP synthase (glutamine-hydrolysing)